MEQCTFITAQDELKTEKDRIKKRDKEISTGGSRHFFVKVNKKMKVVFLPSSLSEQDKGIRLFSFSLWETLILKK